MSARETNAPFRSFNMFAQLTGHHHGYMSKAVMLCRNCPIVPSMRPKEAQQGQASQIFHIEGHRIEAAKGLAPHARFGGLLFACNLAGTPTQTPGLPRKRVWRKASHSVSFAHHAHCSDRSPMYHFRRVHEPARPEQHPRCYCFPG